MALMIIATESLTIFLSQIPGLRKLISEDLLVAVLLVLVSMVKDTSERAMMVVTTKISGSMTLLLIPGLKKLISQEGQERIPSDSLSAVRDTSAQAEYGLITTRISGNTI